MAALRVVVTGLACLFLAEAAWAGEIILIDPAREKSQRLPQSEEKAATQERRREQALEEARRFEGRGTLVPYSEAPPDAAAEAAREARAQLDGAPLPGPMVILKSGPPPSDAAKARASAKSWITPGKTDPRCKTENVIGGIEGQTQGNMVIQTTTGGVTTLCK